MITRSPQTLEAPPLATDEDLVRWVALGDQRAFEAIYERYREPLYRYCHSIMRQREDAEEAFQATMLSAYQALSAGAEREIALRPWLYRIAHNACISALRKRPRHTAAELTGFEAAPGDVGAHTELAEDLRQLQRDLAELPDGQRSALVMRELGGLSHVEIGRALGEDATAVKQLIYSARSRLHDLAEGRDLACESVRRTLSDGDGRSLRGRGLRAHLSACAGCRSWQAGLHARPAKLAALAPVLSAAAFQQILQGITGTAAAAGLGAGVAAAGAGAGAVGGAAGGATGAGAAATVGGGAALGGGGAALAGSGAALGGTAAATGAGLVAGGAATSGGLMAVSGGLAAKLAIIGSATLIGGGTAAVPAIESAVREDSPPARVQVVIPADGAAASSFVETAPPTAPVQADPSAAVPGGLAPAIPGGPASEGTSAPLDPSVAPGTSGVPAAPAGLPDVSSTGPPADPGASPADGASVAPTGDAPEAPAAPAAGDEGQSEPPDPEGEVTPVDPTGEASPSDSAASLRPGEAAERADQPASPEDDAGTTVPSGDPAPAPPVSGIEAAIQRAREAAIQRAREAARRRRSGGGEPAQPAAPTTTLPITPSGLGAWWLERASVQPPVTPADSAPVTIDAVPVAPPVPLTGP